EGYYYPIRIKTINLHEQFDLSNIPDDKQLHQIISTEDWFIETRIKRIEDELNQFKDCLDIFDEKRKQINLETQRLVKLKGKVENLKNNQIRNESLDTVVANLRIKKNTLSLDYKRLLRNIEKRFGHLRNQDEIQNENLEIFSKVLFSRFDKAIKSCVNELLSFIDSENKKCKQLKFQEQFNG
ncbi:MAG: hypothetical protein PHP01_09570, partial [Phycisphaerae bacterium]|nr:hypothetical protein [Phycisphaerae bacterium]